MRPRTSPPTPVRYGSRDGSRAPDDADRTTCPACAGPLPSSRARHCSAACKQRAYRRRHAPPSPDAIIRAAQPGRPGAAPAQTVYACPACEQRLLGERRCPDCNRFCRRLGLGGLCPNCDEPLLVTELLGEEVRP
jgi:predicted amidophosphoribosyltransferase